MTSLSGGVSAEVEGVRIRESGAGIAADATVNLGQHLNIKIR